MLSIIRTGTTTDGDTIPITGNKGTNMKCYFCDKEIDQGYWIALDTKNATCEAMVCKACYQSRRDKE